MNPSQDIVVRAAIDALLPVAQHLARSLGLPLRSGPDQHQAAPASRPQFVLLVMPRAGNDYQLALQQPGSRELPLCVHFAEGPLAHRRKYGGGRKQPLARAVGIKPGHLPTIVDATAGLARDAFVLTCLGCQVTMLERSPILGALVKDGLRRAQLDTETAAIVGNKLRLISGNATQLLETIAPQDKQVIYLDPMYPERSKSALVKKEMRLVRALVGDDNDTHLLLAKALQQAQQRVVVKRPRLAEPLPGPPPSTRIESKTTRYDIYLSSGQH